MSESDGLYAVTARFTVPDLPALVRQVLTDYDNIPRFMPGRPWQRDRREIDEVGFVLRKLLSRDAVVMVERLRTEVRARSAR